MAIDIDLKQLVKKYGHHNVKFNVTGDGFRQSEFVSFEYDNKPFIKAYVGYLTATNVQEDVSQIDFYVDGEIAKTIEHDITDTSDLKIDYSDTPITDDSSNEVYLKFICSYGEFDSNTTYTSYTELSIDSLETTYTFVLDESDGYYKPNNKNKDSTFAICRINYTHRGRDKNLVIYWRQSSEAKYDFGLVGQKDVALSLDANIDSNVLLNAKGKTYTTDQKLVIKLEPGTHFYDIKYRKDGSQSADWDRFDFRYVIEEI